MDLFGSAVDALGMIFTFESFLYMLFGVILGNIIGIIPGLGGNFCLAVLIPFLFAFDDKILAIIFLEGAHAAVATGGAVTSILINTPGSAMNAATCLDGFPMAQKGQGARAISIATVASGLGGVIGAVVLFLALPAFRPLIMLVSPPEYFALALFGLVMIAFVGEGSFFLSILSGMIGLVVSCIGEEAVTGTARYSYGIIQLYDGIHIVPVVIGLFAYAELISMIVEKRGVIREEYLSAKDQTRQVWQGVKDNFIYWWLLIRTSVIGAILGFIPGIGGEVAGFIAYGHAAQTSKHPEEFGKGAIEGVLAPEAANNSKEGGALIPTVAFGIPGSSGMAILLGAFIILGVDPGPNMLGKDLPFTLVIVWTLAIANVLAAATLLAGTKYLAKIANLKNAVIVPSILVIAGIGAYAVHYSLYGVIIAVLSGFLGYAMRKYHYSRATFTIGLVLGGLAENSFKLSWDIFGPAFVTRPITALLLCGLLTMVIWGIIKGRKKSDNKNKN